VPAMQMQCTENSKQIFPEMKLRGLVPNFYIHVSVSDRSATAVQKKRRTDRENTIYIYRSQIHDCRNWDRGRAVSFLGIFFCNFRYSAAP
jgi:hypothetical protein